MSSKKTTMSVQEIRKLLGVCKTESYWILHHKDIPVVIVNGQIRIVKGSCYAWLNSQDHYKTQEMREKERLHKAVDRLSQSTKENPDV